MKNSEKNLEQKSAAQKGNNFFAALYRDSMMAFVFVGLFIVCSVFVPYFFTVRNLVGLMLSVSQIGMVASTMMFCLASRDFDLSVGSQVAFFGVLAVMISNATNSMALTIAGVLVAGLVVGGANGFFVAKLKINALIATLASMQIIRGFAFIASGGQAVGAVDVNFFTVGTSSFLQIPIPVFVTVVTFVLFGFVLNYTVFGRNVLAVGGNPDAVYLAGINVNLVKAINFTVQGVVCAIAGFILASRLTSGQPNVAQGFELQVISACVLGGVSLYGGKASMLGVVAGVFIMGTVQNVMNLINIPVFYQYVVSGIILLLAVGFDQFKSTRSK